MFYALREVNLKSLGTFLIVAMLTTANASYAAATPLSANEIMHRADDQRGVSGPCRFQAAIYPYAEPSTPSADEDRVPADATIVEVRSNGFTQQLVFVLNPSKGDVLLATPDAVWLRPRRLHRLTRIPADLRMFSGASVSDVTSIDLIGNYAPTLRPPDESGSLDYVMDLQSEREGIRYPRASYRIRRDDFQPHRIELMSASGKALKSITYAKFELVLGRRVPTKLIVEDYVYKDVSIIVMSDFQSLPDIDPRMFVPDYLLALPDLTS